MTYDQVMTELEILPNDYHGKQDGLYLLFSYAMHWQVQNKQNQLDKLHPNEQQFSVQEYNVWHMDAHLDGPLAYSLIDNQRMFYNRVHFSEHFLIKNQSELMAAYPQIKYMLKFNGNYYWRYRFLLDQPELLLAGWMQCPNHYPFFLDL